MKTEADDAASALVAALLAVDPSGLGGAVLRAEAGPERDGWLARFAALLPSGTAWRRMPARIDDDRLLGGLDLAATLATGRPVAERGLLAEADGGILVLAMAERIEASTAAQIASVLDTGELVVERQGVAARRSSRLTVIALDEGRDDDERAPPRLRDRLAFELRPMPRSARDPAVARPTEADRAGVAAARARLPSVRIGDALVEGLCKAAQALGVDSARAAVHAVRAARARAALEARDDVDRQDVEIAAALVLAPRATRRPEVASDPSADRQASSRSDESDEADAAEEGAVPPRDRPANDGQLEPPADPPVAAEAESPRAPALNGSTPARPDPERSGTDSLPLDDRILAAALAALPPGLLALLAAGAAPRATSIAPGRSGATRQGRIGAGPAGIGPATRVAAPVWR